MALSYEMIEQFAKVTKESEEPKKPSTAYGRVSILDNVQYVQLDGSEILTPVQSFVSAKSGDRVEVSIYNHTATVVGNVSDPSASSGDVSEIGDDLYAQVARIDYLEADNVVIHGQLTANKAVIDDLTAQNVTINGKLTAQEASIENLRATKLDVDVANITFATIENLDATNAVIYNLEAVYGEFQRLTTEKLTAIDASIENLIATTLTVEEAEIKYANIDFANIGQLAVENFFAESGMIKDLVVGDHTVTGEIVGVTIRGDQIVANTIMADKIVVRGEDGLYYKLNTEGMSVEADQTPYNSLDGTVITAKSITATKINVSDLVAFDATIGGFKISTTSLYSGVKESVHNTTRGVYMDKDGQFSLGDANNYVKYYKDTNSDAYRLAITAASIVMGTGDGDLESTLVQLSNSISSLVTDKDGQSLMTQTPDGWTFSMAEIFDSLSSAKNGLNDLENDADRKDSILDGLTGSVEDLGKLTSYVRISTSGGEPLIELGTNASEFKVRITNTRIEFLAGETVMAYMDNTSLKTDRINIRDSMTIGGNYTWKQRGNGNLGLSYTGYG